MIKAIETVYNNYRFRSRLEARWAVFFDTLGVSYEYEKEGYSLNGRYYLPDFWLPELKCWFEVKGQIPSTEEYLKARNLALHSQCRVYIAVGEIKIPKESSWEQDNTELFVYLSPLEEKYDEEWIYPHIPFNAWYECPDCHFLAIQDATRDDVSFCLCHSYAEHDTTRLIAAYTAARQARFERQH